VDFIVTAFRQKHITSLTPFDLMPELQNGMNHSIVSLMLNIKDARKKVL